MRSLLDYGILLMTMQQAKLNEKYTPALHSISSFERTSYKKLHDTATSSFIFCCLTSADTYHFLQLVREIHSKVPEKRFLSQIFLLMEDSPKSLPLIQVFCQCSLIKKAACSNVLNQQHLILPSSCLTVSE